MILVSSDTFYGASDVSDNDVLHFFVVGCTLEHGKFSDTVYTRRACPYYH